MDAACQGASMAIGIIHGIIASMVAFISFIAFIDGILGYFGSLVGAPQLTFEVSIHNIHPISDIHGVSKTSEILGVNIILLKKCLKLINGRLERVI